MRLLLSKQRTAIDEIKKATNYDTTRKLIEQYDETGGPQVRFQLLFMTDLRPRSVALSLGRTLPPPPAPVRALRTAPKEADLALRTLKASKVPKAPKVKSVLTARLALPVTSPVARLAVSSNDVVETNAQLLRLSPFRPA